MIDLHEQTIIVTRPEPKGIELCEKIKALGGIPIYLPTISFAPPADLAQFQKSIMQLGEVEWLIFISPQAVFASISSIRQAWPQFPDTVKFAAIGEGTAAALKEAGYFAVLYPKQKWSGQGLLHLPEFQQVTGKKIAIIRGEGGRKEVDQVLKKRGAEVLQVIAYRRILPQVDVDEALHASKKHKVDAIVCTSFEGVSHLKILCGDKGWPYFKTIPLVVVSERIKRLARDLGFQTIWTSPNASHQAILEILAQNRKKP